MNRRQALKSAATAGLVMAAMGLAPYRARLTAPVDAAEVSGRLLRGASGGRVMESVDGGASWQCVARLGEACAVHEIVERNGILHARISAQGHTFALWSRDARMWRTPDALESRV